MRPPYARMTPKHAEQHHRATCSANLGERGDALRPGPTPGRRDLGSCGVGIDDRRAARVARDAPNLERGPQQERPENRRRSARRPSRGAMSAMCRARARDKIGVQQTRMTDRAAPRRVRARNRPEITLGRADPEATASADVLDWIGSRRVRGQLV